MLPAPVDSVFNFSLRIVDPSEQMFVWLVFQCEFYTAGAPFFGCESNAVCGKLRQQDEWIEQIFVASFRIVEVFIKGFCSHAQTRTTKGVMPAENVVVGVLNALKVRFTVANQKLVNRFGLIESTGRNSEMTIFSKLEPSAKTRADLMVFVTVILVVPA